MKREKILIFDYQFLIRKKRFTIEEAHRDNDIVESGLDFAPAFSKFWQEDATHQLNTRQNIPIAS